MEFSFQELGKDVTGGDANVHNAFFWQAAKTRFQLSTAAEYLALNMLNTFSKLYFTGESLAYVMQKK